MGLGLALGAALGFSGCTDRPEVRPTEAGLRLGGAVARLQRDAAAVQPLVKTRWAQQFLAGAAQAVPMAPRRIYVDGGTGTAQRAYSEREYEALPSDARAGLTAQTIDEEAYYLGTGGSPVFAARLLDLVGENEVGNLASRRALEIDYESVGTLRMLAGVGVSAVGVSAAPRQRAIYSLPGDQGDVALFNRQHQGSLALVSGRFPADASARAAVGGGYDFILVQNTLRRGYVHPAGETPQPARIDLGVSDEDYLRGLREALRQGGRLLVYNVCPAPTGPYSPETDCRNPFPTAAWQAAGFRVRDYDRGDNEAARAYGRALGWDTGPRRVNLETDLVASYSLLERL